MTTIAYKHSDKTVAVDSRRSIGTFILTDKANKTIKKGDLTFVLSGKVRDIKLVVDSYPEHNNRVDNVMGFLIKPHGVYSLTSNKEDIHVIKCECDDACGSGTDFAVAAMDFGKSASEAVAYAATRDMCTGGEIQVIPVGE